MPGLLAAISALPLAGCHDPAPADDPTGTSASGFGTQTSGATDASSTGDSSGATDGSEATDSSGDTGTGDPTSGCGQAIAGGGTVSGFNTLTLNIGSDEYKVQTNPWGGAEQTITAGDDSVFRIDSITHPAGAEDWEVASFPSVYRGMPYGGDGTAESGMPIAISDINNVSVGLAINALETGYQGNATFDVYFTNGESYTGGPPDVYLMVWFDAKGLNPINSPGEGWTCAGDPPTFIEACSAAGDATIEGKKFYRFVGPNGAAQVITYVPETRMNAWEFDLNGFIQDAVGAGVLNSNMYLQGVQGGFELADAGAGLTIQEFCVDIY
jgi:hypothetical protein